MNKAFTYIAAVAVIAGAATGVSAQAVSSASAATIGGTVHTIPGTPVPELSSVRWNAAQDVFYGYKHCYNDDYNDHDLGSEDGVKHDAVFCFTVRIDNKVLILAPDTLTTQGREYVAS